jgi:hypothetical protein
MNLKYEQKFWGDCCNTFDEELKQRVYAQYLTLEALHH